MIFAGPAAALLETSNNKIEMEFAASERIKPISSTSAKSNSTAGSNAHKLVFINRVNSEFTTTVVPTNGDTNTSDNRKRRSTKRKAIVVSDDDDFEDLDFGDRDSSDVSARQRPRSSATAKLVVIDDSTSGDSDASESEGARTCLNDRHIDRTGDTSQDTTFL